MKIGNLYKLKKRRMLAVEDVSEDSPIYEEGDVFLFLEEKKGKRIILLAPDGKRVTTFLLGCFEEANE